MNNKLIRNALLFLITSNLTIGWSASMSGTNLNIRSDFKLPSSNWKILSGKDLKGKHEIFDIKNEKEHVFLYRLSPGAEIGVKEHDAWEEVTIINGTLEWLSATGKVQQILNTGAYVDRPPYIKHGPFKAGSKGCLMHVRMHI